MNLIIISTNASIKMGHGKEYIENIVNRFPQFNINRFNKIKLITLKINESISLNPSIELIELDKYILDREYYKNKYGYLWTLIYGIKRVHIFNKILKRVYKEYNKGDIVYFIEHEYISLYFNNKILKTKPIITQHTMDLGGNENSLIKSVYKKISFYANQRIFKKCRAIILHGDYICNIFISNFPQFKEKAIIAHYGVGEFKNETSRSYSLKQLKDKYKIDFQNDNINLLLFGMLRKEKGIDRFINQISNYPKINKINIIIAGKNLDYEEKELYSQFLKIPNLKFINKYIDIEDIQYFYISSDFLILPYLKHMVSQSGPLKIGIKYELPILGTMYGEIGHFINKNNIGITYDVYKEQDLYDKLNFLLTNTHNYIPYIRQVKLEMSWAVMAQTIWNVLNN